MRLDIPHYKAYTNAIKKSFQRIAYFPIKKFVFLLWFFFQCWFFVCFFSNVLMNTCFHSQWLYFETWNLFSFPLIIFRNMKLVFTPTDYISKHETCFHSHWLYFETWNLFSLPLIIITDQIILVRLLPALSIICKWNVPFFSPLFLWNKYFTFLDLLTHISLLHSDCSKCVRF